MRLSEYLRDKVRLTLNKDYASHLLMVGLASMSCSETLINEIELLPRDCVIKIDTASQKLEIGRVNYHENTVSVNSREGIQILDDWFRRYTELFRNLRAKTSNITIDLSGGLDSRMSFILMLKSGVNLNEIDIRSRQGKGYTLEEDYGIASEIAKHFGFTLNNHEHFTGGELNYSLEDSINIALYARMCVHKQIYYAPAKNEDKHFHITGFNGETVRSRWDLLSLNNFIESWLGYAKTFSEGVREPLCESLKKILRHSIEEISKKKDIDINNFSEISTHLYRSTWGRSHFGSYIASDLMTNQYTFCPLSDYYLQKLKLDDVNCPDKNLLRAGRDVLKLFLKELESLFVTR